MLRAPGAEEHAGTPTHGRRALAAPDRRAKRSGKGHAARPAPYSPGPPAPSIRPPGLLRAAATEEASKPWEPWPGRGEGEAPRGASARVPCRPPGALSGSGKGPGGGAVGRGTQAPGPAGASGSPGAALGSRGWGGGTVRGPSAAAQTGAGRGAARKRGRGGGTRGGAGQPGNPSLSGPQRSVRGGANPMTPLAPAGPPPSGPFSDPRPRTPRGHRRERGP